MIPSEDDCMNYSTSSHASQTNYVPPKRLQSKRKVQTFANNGMRPLSLTKKAIQSETPNRFQVNQALTLQAETNTLLKKIISQNVHMIKLLQELVESTKE